MISGTKSTLLPIIILLFGITAALNTSLMAVNKPQSNQPIALTLPAKTMKALSLGYAYCWSAILWMETVSYYGAMQEHADFTYLYGRLHTITTLNPDAEHAYYMAATVLPWATGDTELSNRIIQQAIRHFPNDWRWPYYYGFNAYWFKHDFATAERFLSLAATLPKAPPIVAFIALRIHAQQGNMDTALVFLDRLIHEKQDAHIRQQLLTKRKTILTEKKLRLIDQWLADLPHRKHNKTDLDRLQAKGYPVYTPLPDGGSVIFNKAGEIVSSMERKRFKVFASPKLQKRR